MSLINKMLQDLDARGGKPGVAPGQQELRAVDTPRKRLLPVLLGVGAAGLVALAAGSWWGWHYFTSHTVKPRPAPVMVVVPQAPASVPAPTAAAAALASAANAGGGAIGKASPPAAAGASEAAPVTAARSPAGGSAAGGTAARADHESGDPAGPVLADDVVSAPAPHARKRKHDAREAKAGAQAERGNEGLLSRHRELARLQVQPAHREEGAASAGGVSRDLGPAQLAENRYRRALQDLQEGRNAEALVELQHAVELDPHHEAARQTLVTLLIENHRTDEAIPQLLQALALNARQPDMAMLLARLQLESGGPALDTLLRTLPYAGDNAEYQGFVAGVLQRAQRHGEAVEHYQAALKLAPQKGVWWMGLGISLQAEKRLPEARAAYARARAASGMTPELLAFLDRKLEALGR